MRRGAAAEWMYGATIVLGAFLLFLVEPMATKELLPVLGGSSAVWLTALCFFQVVLLLGYGYAHWMTRIGGGGRMHAGMLALAAATLLLPRVESSRMATGHPAAAIFVGLLARVGLPFLLLSATSPLLQAWFARATGSAVPYGWFAWSNGSSLLALMLYPLAVEPRVTLGGQRVMWAAGFLVYAGMCALATLRAGRAAGAGVVPLRVAEGEGDMDRGEGGGSNRRSLDFVPDDTSWWRRVLWFVLPMAGAMQLAAVTGHLTQNVAAIPLLWVVPLAVYLLSFVAAFEFPALYRRWLVMRVLLVMLASLGYLLSKTGTDVPLVLGVGFFVLELFAACWFLHAELYRLRPAGARGATEFYLLMAAGGAAGTTLVAMVSPVVFRSNYDVPLAFGVTAAAALLALWEEGWQQRMLWGVGVALSCVLVAALRVEYGRDSVVRMRSFYGTLRVRESHRPPEAVTSRVLVNGSIQHGMQWFAEEFRRVPMTYYAKDSGVGLAMRFCCADRPRRVGVVGLGAGTMAAYGRVGDATEFYEINPQVTALARELFTYLRESRGQVTVVPGDARVTMGAQGPQGFDVLVVDAFSGDAIPVHLLTREAMAMYRRQMAPGGVMAFHVSNQYLDLPPVVAKLAEDAGMRARVVNTSARAAVGEFAATWVLVSARREFFDQPELQAMALPVEGVEGMRVWTDEYSSLLPVFRWGRGMGR